MKSKLIKLIEQYESQPGLAPDWLAYQIEQLYKAEK